MIGYLTIGMYYSALSIGHAKPTMGGQRLQSCLHDSYSSAPSAPDRSSWSPDSDNVEKCDCTWSCKDLQEVPFHLFTADRS